MIKNIILDMGNVLLRFDPEVPLQAYVDNDTDRDIIRKELFDHPDWLKGDTGEVTNHRRYELVKSRIPDHLQEPYRMCALHWHICLTLIPGAKEFIDYAKSKGYSVYVLSNADDTFHDYMPKNYDMSKFDGVTVSSDVKLIKPDKAIYEYFLAQHGLNACESLFIDDRADNVAGAESVSIHGFVFKGDFHTVIKEYSL